MLAVCGVERPIEGKVAENWLKHAALLRDLAWDKGRAFWKTTLQRRGLKPFSLHAAADHLEKLARDELPKDPPLCVGRSCNSFFFGVSS